MSPTRVFVVDDSPLFREVLRELLEAEGDVRVIGEAGSGEEAISKIASLEPDLVTVDIEMPGLGGLETVGRLMARRPVPILVLTGHPAENGTSLAFEAIARGALEIASKSSLGLDDGQSLRALAKQLGKVRVVRHPEAISIHRVATVPPTSALFPSAWRACPVVGVAASSGGPSAIVQALETLPRDFPACVALVQHLPRGFVDPFRRFLSEHLALSIGIVTTRTKPRPGTLLIGPDDHHLVMSSDDGAFVSSNTPPVAGHRPSATLLFESLARVRGSSAAGVVLSGMGDDGASGLLSLRRAGGETIAQDAATSPRCSPDGPVHAHRADPPRFIF
jgi:two-component system chemotaxis response regulator CheB